MTSRRPPLPEGERGRPTRRRKGRFLPSRPAADRARRKTSKFTLAERNAVFDLLARGWPLATTRQRVRTELGLEVSAQLLRGYRLANAEELEQRRERWHAQLRGEPLTRPRNRIRELGRQYALEVLGLYSERCPACGGEGTVPASLRPVDERGRVLRTADRERADRRCEACRGHGRSVPAEARGFLELLEGDVRLETLPGVPPSIQGDRLERCRGILRQIREEVGDHWSPRDRGETGPDGPQAGMTVSAEVAAKLVDALAQVLRAPAEAVVARYQVRAGQRGLPPDPGDGDAAGEA